MELRLSCANPSIWSTFYRPQIWINIAAKIFSNFDSNLPSFCSYLDISHVETSIRIAISTASYCLTNVQLVGSLTPHLTRSSFVEASLYQSYICFGTHGRQKSQHMPFGHTASCYFTSKNNFQNIWKNIVDEVWSMTRSTNLKNDPNKYMMLSARSVR